MFYKAMLKKKKNKKAFTLIELIVVIAIIGVLVAILVPVMGGFVTSAQNTTNAANARTIYSVAQAQAQFYLSKNSAVAASTYDSKTSASPSTYMFDVKAMVTGSAASGWYQVIVGTNNYVSSVTYYATTASAAPSAAYPTSS
jgi:prepilin-type N-terminal cleavage/methylation domain-containing protein